MENVVNLSLMAKLSIAGAILSLLCLLILHFVSPEYKPSWRMVSEYALGKHKWLLTAFFVLWSLSTFFLAVLLWDVVSTRWAMFGVLLLLVSAIGEFMGGVFDVKHKLHGLSFLLGIPSLAAAALIISYHLITIDNWSHYRMAILISAHAPWISIVLMAVSMMVMMSGFKKAGLPMGPNAEPPKAVPDGVIALSGYANRILVLCYLYWLILIAKTYLSF
jgi:hypothetical membrane protein